MLRYAQHDSIPLVADALHASKADYGMRCFATLSMTITLLMLAT